MPPAERADALEARVRRYQALVDELAVAWERFDTAGSTSDAALAYHELRAAMVALQELRSKPIARRPR